MTRLAQTYMHLKIHPTAENLELLAFYAEALAKSVTPSTLLEDGNINVDVDEGTIRVWITVAGGIYAAVAGYGSFRSGIDHLVADGRWFSNQIIEPAFPIWRPDLTTYHRDSDISISVLSLNWRERNGSPGG